MLERLVEVSEISPSQAKAKFGLGQRWIVSDRELIFPNCFLDSASLVQRFSIVELGLGVLGQHFCHLLRSLQQWNHATDELGRTERAKRNYYDRPAQAVPNPCRQEAWRRQGSGPRPFDPKHLASLGFADFPNESVVVKMQQRRGRHNANQSVPNRFRGNGRLREPNRAVSHNQSDI